MYQQLERRLTEQTVFFTGVDRLSTQNEKNLEFDQCFPFQHCSEFVLIASYNVSQGLEFPSQLGSYRRHNRRCLRMTSMLLEDQELPAHHDVQSGTSPTVSGLAAVGPPAKCLLCPSVSEVLPYGTPHILDLMQVQSSTNLRAERPKGHACYVRFHTRIMIHTILNDNFSPAEEGFNFECYAVY